MTPEALSAKRLVSLQKLPPKVCRHPNCQFGTMQRTWEHRHHVCLRYMDLFLAVATMHLQSFLIMNVECKAHIVSMYVSPHG